MITLIHKVSPEETRTNFLKFYEDGYRSNLGSNDSAQINI